MSDEKAQEATEPEAPQETGGSAGQPDGAEKKLVAGILGIVLGAIGIHKFYLGYTKEGVIMLLVSVVSCGFLSPIMGVIGLVEGIMYLMKPDEEFVETYINGEKGWF